MIRGGYHGLKCIFRWYRIVAQMEVIKVLPSNICFALCPLFFKWFGFLTDYPLHYKSHILTIFSRESKATGLNTSGELGIGFIQWICGGLEESDIEIILKPNSMRLLVLISGCDRSYIRWQPDPSKPSDISSFRGNVQWPRSGILVSNLFVVWITILR